MKKNVQKPDRKSSIIAFSKSGSVREVEESYPRNKAELEFTIGKKFIETFLEKNKTQYVCIENGQEPFDLLCTNSLGEKVGIQIVEVVDTKRTLASLIRNSYVERIIRTLGNDIDLFNGCRITLYDRGRLASLPKINSKGGVELIRKIAEYLKRIAVEIHTLEIGKIRFRKILHLSEEDELVVIVVRIFSSKSSHFFNFYWDVDATLTSDKLNNIVSKSIIKKIEKKYAKPEVKEFILLAYSLDLYPFIENPDGFSIKEILKSQNHPFDAVWYFYPIPNMNGIAVKLF